MSDLDTHHFTVNNYDYDDLIAIDANSIKMNHNNIEEARETRLAGAESIQNDDIEEEGDEGEIEDEQKEVKVKSKSMKIKVEGHDDEEKNKLN